MQPDEETSPWSDPYIFRALVEQMQEAVIVVDRDGIVRIWNAGAQAVFGHDAADMIDRPLDTIIPAHLRQPHEQGFRKAVESGRMKYDGRIMATRAVHKDGTKRYVDMSFGLLRDAAGKVFGVSAVARDCTARQLSTRAGGAGS